MNEEAIQVAYDLFVQDGYTKTIEDFKMLMANNPEGQQVAFDLFKSDGYTKEMADFQILMGAAEPEEEVVVEEPLKKKDILESPLAGGGSEQSVINTPTRDELQDMLDAPRNTAGQNKNEDRYVDPIKKLGMYPDGGVEAVDNAFAQQLKDIKVTAQSDKEQLPFEEERKAKEAETQIAVQQKYEKERQAILKSPEFEVALTQTNADAINQGEDDAVGYFTKLYAPYGFSFRTTGIGDAMVVYPPNSNDPLEVDLDTFFSDDKEASALREYVKANAVTPDESATTAKEQDDITRAQRVRGMRNTGRINSDGTESTVLMASGIVDGKFVAYPTLFPDTEGDNGQYGSDPMWWKEEKGIDAFNEAKKRGEVFEFDTEDEAQDFAEGSWKDINTVDSEANDFFTKRGYDYSSYKKNYDRYEEIRDELYFLEEANFYEKDLTDDERKEFSNLYVNGKRRNGAVAERIAELKLEQDKLYSVVNDTELMTVQEDFDYI